MLFSLQAEEEGKEKDISTISGSGGVKRTKEGMAGTVKESSAQLQVNQNTVPKKSSYRRYVRC